MNILQRVKADLKVKLPADLVDALFGHYQTIKESFYLDKHEPAELNGGKFAEICHRILQFETNNGAYTPVGQQIPRLANELRQFEQIPAADAIDSYRIHIPRTLLLMCDVRNRRGVAHPNIDINPNYADSSLLVICADWVMAELFRTHYQCSPEKAQIIVDSLVQRRLPLVHEIDDVKRVLLPGISPKDKVLLLLYTEHPSRVQESDLFAWLEVKTNISNYRKRYFESLHSEKMIEYRKGEWCLILPTGMRYVESQYQDWLEELNKEI